MDKEPSRNYRCILLWLGNCGLSRFMCIIPSVPLVRVWQSDWTQWRIANNKSSWTEHFPGINESEEIPGSWLLEMGYNNVWHVCRSMTHWDKNVDSVKAHCHWTLQIFTVQLVTIVDSILTFVSLTDWPHWKCWPWGEQLFNATLPL